MSIATPSARQHDMNGEGVLVESAKARDEQQPESGVTSLDEARSEPLETVAAGHATDKQAISEVAEPLRDLPSKGKTDDPEVKDLGFQTDYRDPHPLFKGLTNEELWLCVRRFSKQTFHLRAIPALPPGGLDMLYSDDQEFSADKLRAEFERLYITTLTGGACFVKHIARLRSWRESKRTIGFLSAYVAAWTLDLVIPAILTMIMCMVAFKPVRGWLFPPAPLALVSAKHGGLQPPKAGVLGSHDSLTGAPEAHRGEAVEHEASQFLTGVTSVAVSAAMGRTGDDTTADTDSEDEDSPPKGGESVLPDPVGAISGLADARGRADNSKPSPEVDAVAHVEADGSTSTQHDSTKVPVQAAVWSKTRPLMQGIATISDTQERFANALSPAPPFSVLPKYRLASCFIPLILGASLADAHYVSKGFFAALGFAFFGQPLMDQAWHWLNAHVPDWPQYLEIQNTLLKGVPTNAQLTIALLRVAEAHKSPIPPPPAANKAPPAQPAHHEVASLAANNPLGSEDEITAAALPAETSSDKVDKPAAKQGVAVSLLKSAAAGVISLGGGKAKVEASTIGNERARNRLGALPKKHDKKFDGPSRFRARFHGTKGHAWITTNAVTPSLAFSKGYKTDDTKPVWTMQIEDIRELIKTSGLGWKSKIIAGAVLKRDIADALEIVDAQGNTFKLTAVPRRDELFNRLAAIGSHKWSMC